MLTFAGAWAQPGTGDPSDVVNAANPDLVFEVPIDAPWSFGPIAPDARAASPSYAEAIEIAVANEFIMPRMVEPSLPMSVRKISPTVPSSYLPAVM